MLAHAAFTEVFECLLAKVDWFSLHIRPTTNCYGVTQQVDLQPRNRYEMPFLRGAENARYQQIQLWWFLNISRPQPVLRLPNNTDFLYQRFMYQSS